MESTPAIRVGPHRLDAVAVPRTSGRTSWLLVVLIVLSSLYAALAPHPYPFVSALDLLATCDRTRSSIDEIAAANERALHPGLDVDARLDAIWDAMAACVEHGLATEGVLPGGLGVQELPLEPEVSRGAVDRVARDRQPDRLEMDPDLVRAAGLEPYLEQGALAFQRWFGLEPDREAMRQSLL